MGGTAALVSEEDYTMYLVFGVMALLIVVAKIVLVVICYRRVAQTAGKYNFSSMHNNKDYSSKDKEGEMALSKSAIINNNGAASGANGGNGVCYLSASEAPDAVLLPSDENGSIPPPPYARLRPRPGINGTNSGASTLKRVRLADANTERQHHSIEYDLNYDSNGEEQLFEDDSNAGHCGRVNKRVFVNERWPHSRTNGDMAYMKAPRELWLV